MLQYDEDACLYNLLGLENQMERALNRLKDSTPALMGGLVFGLAFCRVIYFFLGSDDGLVGVIPDDAFYYVQMAHHRVVDGLWTFDGSSPATGFHFLFGYFLFFILKVFPGASWKALYALIGMLASVSIAGAAAITCRTAQSVFDERIAAAAAAPFFTAVSLMQSTVMMESWLVLLLGALTVSAVAKDSALDARNMTTLFVIGLLGSLARTDYGVLPGVLWGALAITQRSWRDRALQQCTVILAGAILGIMVVVLHCYLVSGQFSQASAQIKLHWSALSGHNILPAINLTLQVLFPFLVGLDSITRCLFPALVVLLSCISILIKRPFDPGSSRPLARSFFVGSVLVVIAYVFFYRHNSAALQIWYVANLIVPIGVGMAAMFFYIFKSWSIWPSILLCASYFYSGLTGVFSIPWPHQAGMKHAGLFLKNHYTGERFAAWNAGIISYFSARDLINIDGLVNDEALPYIKSNTLMDYLKDKNVKYLVDYEAMLRNKFGRVLGGYDDDRVDRCISPVQSIDGDAPGWANSRVTIFAIKRDCL